MTTIHLCIHARPPALVATATARQHDGLALQVLALSPSLLNHPLPISFDQALERLNMVPQLLVEPDGSFVFSREVQGRREQVEGQLVEGGAGGLMCAELWGDCSMSHLEVLLDVLVPPKRELVFQLVREGLFIDEDQLSRLLK